MTTEEADFLMAHFRRMQRRRFVRDLAFHAGLLAVFALVAFGLAFHFSHL